MWSWNTAYIVTDEIFIFSTTTMDFPVEILEEFIDAVYEDGDFKDLVSCLSVSRVFRHRSRPYIFDSIDIDFCTPNFPGDPADGSLKRLALLRQLISNDSPSSDDSILPFITTVNVGIYYVYELFKDNDDLSHILSRLADSTELDTLGIYLSYEAVESPSWNNFPTTFRKNLRNVSRVPSLRALTVVGILDIPETFLRGTHIRHLELVRSWFRRSSGGGYEDEGGLTVDLPSPDLVSLSLNASEFDLTKILPKQKLKTLRLHFRPDSSLSKGQDFLQWSHESLDSLTLEFAGMSGAYNIITRGLAEYVFRFIFW